MYAEPFEVELAESLGYTAERSVDVGSRFTNGTRRVWATRYGWQTADIIENRYVGHQTFDHLSEALLRPLIEE